MILRPALVVLAPVVLSGCIAGAVGADEPPAETFVLPTEAVIDEPSASRGPQLLVPEPITLDVLSSPRVVVRVGEREVQYLGESRFGDTLTRLTQIKLKRALEGGRGIGAAALPGEGLAIDFQVITDIRSFEIRTGPPDTAFVSLAIKLLNDRNGNVVAQRLFQSSRLVVLPADEELRNDAYVAALDDALANALIDVRDWVEGRVGRGRRAGV